MQRVVVDTDVVSFYLKNDSRFEKYASELDGKQLVMSFQTLAELLLWQDLRDWGQRKRDLFTQEIRKQYVIYPVDRALCQRWAWLRAEYTRISISSHVVQHAGETCSLQCSFP